MTNVVVPGNGVSRFLLPTLDEQVALVEKHKLDTLLFCPNSWAIRHVFINQDTSEVVRARFNRWDYLYCGHRKADQWRLLVKSAELRLFLTLTKAGKTVDEAARALTTFTIYVALSLLNSVSMIFLTAIKLILWSC